MSIENKINKIEKKMKKVEDEKQSLAYEMLTEQKKQNKRLFIIIIVLCLMLTGLGIYTIYLLNDITVVETTEETYDMSTKDGNNNYVGGNNNGEITNN